VATRAETVAVGTLSGRLTLGRRPVALAVFGLAALLVALVGGVAIGTVPVAPGDTIAILARHLLGVDLARSLSPSIDTIVWDLRLPAPRSRASSGTHSLTRTCSGRRRARHSGPRSRC
jgi:hypothetical protein